MQPEDGQSTRRAPVAAGSVLGLLATMLTAALALGSCGGDDDTPNSLTKAEFTARGDEVCRQAHEQFAELQPNPPITAEKAAALQEALIQISEDELSQIRALGPPPEVEPALDRYLRAREEGIGLLRKGLEAAEEKDAFAYEAIKQRVAAGQVHRLELARAVGFTVCSRPIPEGEATG
jgi:hypothetical protein